MEIEERARQMGWTPQEEFRGNPDNWIDAETFVERAETSLPIAKGTIKKLEGEIAGLKKDLRDFADFHRTTAEREYNRAMQDLKKKQIEAVEEGDTDKFKAAQAEIEDLQQHPVVTGKTPAGQDNVAKDAFTQWQSENPWFNSDFEMFEYAQKIDQWLANQKDPKKDIPGHLAKVTQMVKEKFPDRFDGGNNSRRRGPAAVEGGDSLATVATKGKGFNALPKEAKELCDRLIKQMGNDSNGKPYMTREKYARDFWGE